MRLLSGCVFSLGLVFLLPGSLQEKPSQEILFSWKGSFQYLTLPGVYPTNSLRYNISGVQCGFSLTSGCNSVGFRFVLVFRFQPSLSGAVNLCPAPNLSLTNGSASDVFRVIDSSVYKNVKAREAFKPHACVQLLLQLSLSLSLSCSSIGNTWHALQNHAVNHSSIFLWQRNIRRQSCCHSICSGQT